MRWTNLNSIAAVTLLQAASTVHADVLVVRANGPSAARFVAGKSLPDGAKIALQKGDQIVLLDSHGTRMLAGPGNFVAASTARAAPAPSAMLALAATNDRRARVGAVRTLPNGATARPNIFFVDTATPGAMCVADAGSVALWRANSDREAVTTVSGDGGTAARVAWIKGQSTQSWPAELPVADGRKYRLADDKGMAATGIEFHVLDKAPTDMRTLADSLISRGCKGQIDMLIATTASQ